LDTSPTTSPLSTVELFQSRSSRVEDTLRTWVSCSTCPKGAARRALSRSGHAPQRVLGRKRALMTPDLYVFASISSRSVRSGGPACRYQSRRGASGRFIHRRGRDARSPEQYECQRKWPSRGPGDPRLRPMPGLARRPGDAWQERPRERGVRTGISRSRPRMFRWSFVGVTKGSRPAPWRASGNALVSSPLS
jgi:hypothetical protein